MTQFDPATPRLDFNKPAACGPHDPAGWDSWCKGDRRSVLHPRWVVRNKGRSRFRTDAYGHRAGGGPAPVRLAASTREPAAREQRRGERVRDGAAADGGIYRAGRGLRPRSGFEFPGYCVLRAN